MGWFGRGRSGEQNPLAIEAVYDKPSFLRFIAALRNDLHTNPDNWESETLDHYLEAMEAWTKDWKMFEPKPNPWRHAATILLAASRYE
jgi:hypothetical protein